MPEILKFLKHFIIFYFILNSIIVFLAFKYDCPKDKGYRIRIKAICYTLFGWYYITTKKSS